MPFLVVLAVRLTRGVASTITLLLDRRVMRALPWPYIRGLPRRNPWIALSSICLAVCVLSLLAALAIPAAAEVTIVSAATGLLASVPRAYSSRQ